MPLLKLKLALADSVTNQTLRLLFSDASSRQDIPRWLEQQPHQLRSLSQSGKEFELLIRVMHD